MAAPRLTAELSVTVSRAVIRRGPPAGRASRALVGRAGSCLANCQGLLAYCEDGESHDILCQQGHLCAEKCTCLANTLACSDYCLGAAMVCSTACTDEEEDDGEDEDPHTVDCVLTCNAGHDFCNAACAAYQHGCNAWAESTYGTGGIGGEPDDEITPLCRFSEVRVCMNAFIPRDLPGLSLARPGHPGETMLPDVPGPADCFLTDQRGFSNDITASARMQQEITVDADAGTFRNPWVDIGTTLEVDCDTGAVVDFGVADPSTVRAYSFAKPAPGVFTCQLEAFAANPLVTGAPNIDWVGNLAIGIFPFRTPDGRMIELARIQFSGEVDEFPAFEMYASVNGRPGVPVFQLMPDPDAVPSDLFGLANRPVDASAVIDCFGNPQPRSALSSARASARLVEPAAPVCASCGTPQRAPAMMDGGRRRRS